MPPPTFTALPGRHKADPPPSFLILPIEVLQRIITLSLPAALGTPSSYTGRRVYCQQEHQGRRVGRCQRIPNTHSTAPGILYVNKHLHKITVPLLYANHRLTFCYLYCLKNFICSIPGGSDGKMEVLKVFRSLVVEVCR